MILTQDSLLDYNPQNVSTVVSEMMDFSNKDKRETLMTYLSERLTGGVEPLKSVGKRRGASRASRVDFTYLVLDELEKAFISDDDSGNLYALRNTLNNGDVIINKFGKPCYISSKMLFGTDDDLSELFKDLGRGCPLSEKAYLFNHERDSLRSPSQDVYIRMIDNATSGSRLEFCELNPDSYKIFYSVLNAQGLPMFIFDKQERRFINYSWGQPNAFLRPFHEDVEYVDMAKKLLTRNSENDHTLEVCIEYGCPKTAENNYSNKKRVWKPFGEYWYNSTAVVRETDKPQGITPVGVREIKNMTVPEIGSSIIVGNPDAIPLDDDGVYDDVSYSQMVSFNPQKVLIQIASNDKKGLHLRDSEDVPISQRLKAAEILYNKMPRSRPAQKAPKADMGDTAHVVVALPEKEGYDDSGKLRIESGDDEAQAVLDFVSSNFDRDKEPVEVRNE